MTKICIIGNSHTAAFKSAWDVVKESNNEHSVEFFASSGMTITDTYLRNGVLIPKTDYVRNFFEITSGGKGEVTFAQYDAVVLVGIGPRPVILRNLYRSHRADSHRLDGKRQVVSEEFFQAVCLERTIGQFGTKLHRQIMELAGPKVITVANSMPSEEIVGTDRYPVEFFDSGDDVMLALQYNAIIDHLNEIGIDVLKQPACTLKTPALTKQEFSVNSVKLKGKEHQDSDYSHKNVEYGVISMNEILRMV